ncbi:MAG: hypothetical protein JJ848_006510 [Prochlorococcus marinus CUG1439]|uniref:hypothetical protein n=1 Tax=Prochlorococcus sp. MIT 1314 TaxID=3096220 RepID=UPI001B160148|nr:hypothetical protein [Prochlorococcus sp. MIT 1314]MCR8539986.1 hypothetical protein [Prochlorococcus marinus CUG1439]
MRNLIIASMVFFLLYSNASFRSNTIKALQSITNFIKELPKEEKFEKNVQPKLKQGSSTY